ncbi:hypothetical protein BJ988_005107 [Nocardioides panzhihuensis]|uniref:Uncharacterized protein n=1 Tax=Nocardioides panzhihuensis TaxID=860243 RepID=A0A7Z0DRI9_9ACTN|nr:hypothetical protein [Nocardioides panzhihuensis]
MVYAGLRRLATPDLRQWPNVYVTSNGSMRAAGRRGASFEWIYHRA